MERLLAAIDILPLEPDADRAYGKIRVDFERIGAVVGGNDMLIGAHAISLDAVLVSDSVREFGRIDGLRLENWIRS